MTPFERTAPGPHPAVLRPAFRRLLGTPVNALITLAYAGFVVTVVWPFLRWAPVDAVWSGPREACEAAAGACWAFVAEKLRFLVFGLYPRDLHWQSGFAMAILAALVVVSAVPRTWTPRLVGASMPALALVVAVAAAGSRYSLWLERRLAVGRAPGGES